MSDLRPDARVVFLAPRDPYGALLAFSHEWAQALRDLGQPADVLDLDAPGGMDALAHIAQHERPRAFCGFAGVGGDLRVGDELLYDLIRVPYVGLMFDHPAYFWTRHVFASPFHTLLFTDADHRAVSESLAPPGARRGAFRFGVTPPVAAPRPLADRAIHIVIAKGGRDPDRIRAEWDGPFSLAEREMMDGVLDVALWDSTVPVWEVTLAHARAMGFPPGAERSRQFVATVYAIDEYIRSARAARALRALAPHRPIVIGGDTLAAGIRDERLRLRPTLPFDRLLTVLDDAQVVLNIHPNNRHVPHERLLYGMQRGCVMLSDASPALRATMGDDRFLCFDWREPLEDRFAAWLTEVTRYQPLADRATAHASDAWHIHHGARTVLAGIQDAEIAALTATLASV
jgi:hypothetical protein